MIEVIRTGPLATIQDLGRPGYAEFGVSPSGAADSPSHRLANRLVANPEDAATIEITLGGLEILSTRGGWVALTGAPLPAMAGNRPVAMNAPTYLPPGSRLTLGTATIGLRSYLAIRGGLRIPSVLGSRSTDTLAGLGPRPLAVGDVIGILPPGPRFPNVDLAMIRSLPEITELRIEPGPRADWLTVESFHRLSQAVWTVSPDSNRVGVRLDGSRLDRAIDDELPPEGLVRGAIQVPSAGQPIIFLADHPVTGGYPVVAVVLGADLPLLAQARPGQAVHLRWAAPAYRRTLPEDRCPPS